MSINHHSCTQRAEQLFCYDLAILINEFIVILKELVKSKDIVIKNFGTFKTTYKKEREGRNPKNKVKYKISARKSLSFISSKRLNEKINNS
mgnify:CR=1 FL=1